jgi:hypothetical protein
MSQIFESFRIELEKRVQEALARGERISASDRTCRCPLGCCCDLPRPFATHVSSIAGETTYDRASFIRGFDASTGAKPCELELLGREYARRFP